MLENDLLVSLFSDSPIVSKRDLLRLQKGLQCSKQRMCEALLQLADSVREVLKTGVYVHPCPSFIASDEFGRPLFLGSAFSLIVDESLSLREDFPAWIAAHMIMLLGSCKKMTPSKRAQPKLADAVIEDFLAAQEAASRMGDRISSYLEYDRAFAINFRYHFNRYVSLFASATTERPSPAFGPGANLEKLDASTRPDWLPVPPSRMNLPRTFAEFYYSGPSWKPRSFKTLLSDSIRLPFSRKREMHFHAVPKSIKSYRGVGKTQAWLMGAQLSLQRAFYNYLPPEMPLRDQRMMEDIPDDSGTIDLRDASNTIIWDAVDANIEDPDIRELLSSCRVRHVIIKGKRYKVYAPMMGEGITFPLMTSWFCAIAMAVCDLKGWGHHLVKVYGDDIQTPHFKETCFYLEALGHRVNAAKSYPPDSRFKESCEYHNVSSPSSRRNDARPRFVPSAPYKWHGSPRAVSVVDQVRILEWLHDVFSATAMYTNTFRRFFDKRLPSVASPTEIGYPVASHALATPRYTGSLRSRITGEQPASLRALLGISLRRGKETIFESHADRQALLKHIRRTPHHIDIVDNYAVYDAMFRDSPLFRFHTLIATHSALLDDCIFFKFANRPAGTILRA